MHFSQIPVYEYVLLPIISNIKFFFCCLLHCKIKAFLIDICFWWEVTWKFFFHFLCIYSGAELACKEGIIGNKSPPPSPQWNLPLEFRHIKWFFNNLMCCFLCLPFKSCFRSSCIYNTMYHRKRSFLWAIERKSSIWKSAKNTFVSPKRKSKGLIYF